MTPDISNAHEVNTHLGSLAEIAANNAVIEQQPFTYQPIKLADKDEPTTDKRPASVPTTVQPSSTNTVPQKPITKMDRLLRTNKDALTGYQWAAVLDVLKEGELPNQ